MKTTLIVALIAGAVLRSDAQTACGDDVQESCSGGLSNAFMGFDGEETMEQFCPVVETFFTCESDVGCDIDLSSLGMDAEDKANLVLACKCGPCIDGRKARRRPVPPWQGQEGEEDSPEFIAALCDALDEWAQCQEDADIDCSPLFEDDGDRVEDDMSMDDVATMCAAIADIDLDDIDMDCVSTCDTEEEPTCAQADTFFGTGECGETCGDATKMYLAASIGCDASAFANIDVDPDSDTGMSAAGPSIVLALVSSVFAYMGQQ